MGMTQTVEESIDIYDWFLDMYGRKHYAADIEQSEKRGHEKGKREEKVITVLNMLRKKKYSLNEISEIAGLSEEEILQIAKDNNLV